MRRGSLSGSFGGLSAPQVVPDGFRSTGRKIFAISKAACRCRFPGALYESILLDLSEKPKQRYAYSPLYAIHTPDVPLQGAVTVSIDASELPAELRSKALLATVGRDGGRSAAGGAWKEGRVTTETRSFERITLRWTRSLRGLRRSSRAATTSRLAKNAVV